MEVAASTNEIDEFLNGALIAWLESCLPNPEILTGYQSLLDATIFHVVWRQIDPEPPHHPIPLNDIEESMLRTARAKNFDCVIKNLKQLYEEELRQTLLIIPDCSILGHSPESRAGLEELKLLFTLLLGAAVQCPNKEIFIGRIKELDVETQHAIVDLIKKVTDSQTLVLNGEAINHTSVGLLHDHLVRIARERDRYHSKWISCAAPNADPLDAKAQSSPTINTSMNSDQNHMAVELADLKSRMRKLRQELEEKTEAFIEVKEELEYKNSQYDKLRSDSQEWYTESLRAATYRDEVDVLRERAARADQLEIEIQRFREKLSDIDFHKSRADELREDNRMLLETKEMLEEQLSRSRKRTETSMMLESEIIKYKQKLNDMALERDADKAKLQELLEENTQLQLATKALNKLSDADRMQSEELDDIETSLGDNSLSEQLTNNAQTRAIKLELENRRLQQALEAMRESNFHETTNRLLELEKEKKMLTLKVDQLQENCNRFTQQNQELEDMFKNALEENKKLQDSIDNRQQANERQMQDREVDRMKLIDLEKQVEALTKEKQMIQTLNEQIQRRADDLERFLESKKKELDQTLPRAKACDRLEIDLADLKDKVNLLEKENLNLNKDIMKYKQSLETKEVLLDNNGTQIMNQANEIDNLRKQLQSAVDETAKLHDLENKLAEYESQRKVNNETVSTLQSDLIEKTVTLKKLENELEKLGIDCLSDELNVETVIDKILRNPDHLKLCREILLSIGRDDSSSTSGTCILCQKNGSETSTTDREADLVHHTEEVLSSVSAQWKEQCDQLAAINTELQSTNETLQSENARFKVEVSTMSSQITSLNTQQVALQLANSQLASEKEAIVKSMELLKKERDNLLSDQSQFRAIHEQLTAEYEALTKERETLKTSCRDSRNEIRDVREREEVLQKQNTEMRTKNIALKAECDNNVALRGEHSKLKDDFKNLFTANERFKTDYKNMQEQYKILRRENARLNLQNTELSGELEQAKVLEVELAKTSSRCEMLMQINANLDVDRQALMDHISQLLSQYHELLTHSLDDKQHYHDEEKLFTDRLNNLNRQKEKLEEKIIEFYGKLESNSQKKRAFGSGLVKRVKKASSDLMNKVPTRNNRRSHIDSGGNESDNSADEAVSVASDSNLLKKNLSTQRTLGEPVMSRSLASGSRAYQPLIREDSIRSHRMSMEAPDVTGSSLTLGAAGSRRTVYLVDENPKISDANASTSTTGDADLLTTGEGCNGNNNSTDQAPSTFLMYNRISNVIGSNVTGNNVDPLKQNVIAGDATTNGTKDKKKNDEPSAVWYEYGCV